MAVRCVVAARIGNQVRILSRPCYRDRGAGLQHATGENLGRRRPGVDPSAGRPAVHENDIT